MARRVAGNFGTEKRFLEFAKKCRDFVAYEKMLKIWFFIIPSVVALEQDEGEDVCICRAAAARSWQRRRHPTHPKRGGSVALGRPITPHPTHPKRGSSGAPLNAPICKTTHNQNTAQPNPTQPNQPNRPVQPEPINQLNPAQHKFPQHPCAGNAGKNGRRQIPHFL